MGQGVYANTNASAFALRATDGQAGGRTRPPSQSTAGFMKLTCRPLDGGQAAGKENYPQHQIDSILDSGNKSYEMRKKSQELLKIWCGGLWEEGFLTII